MLASYATEIKDEIRYFGSNFNFNHDTIEVMIDPLGQPHSRWISLYYEK